MADHVDLAFVRFDRFVGAGDHFVFLGPFPNGGVIVDLSVHVGAISGVTVGDLSLFAAVVGSASLNDANILSGLSLFASSSAVGGVLRLFVVLVEAAGAQDFVIPVGLVAGGDRRFMVLNVNLETVTLADVLLAVRVEERAA